MPRKAKEKTNELIEKKAELTNTTSKTNIKNNVDKKTKTTKKSSTSNTLSTPKSSNRTKSKSTTSKKTKTKISSVISTEYYDLPFRYNETIVKVLAQTPNTLFIYWDISDEDKQSYIQKYGLDFFHHTKPYLIITNETLNYRFEVEINDFANSWYLHVNDASCKYKIELGRKFIVNSNSSKTSDTQINFKPYHINDYISITSSNKIESPNNRILFDKTGNTVFFKNTQNNMMEEKNISNLSFMHKIGKAHNIYNLYKEFYHDELISEESGVNLPSSSSSPTFK